MSIILRCDKRGIPATTIFDDAALGWIIDVDEAKALAISLCPLEVIQERPDKIAFHGHTLTYYLGNGLYMRTQVVDALLIMNGAIAIPVISKGGTTFGNHH